MMTIRQEVSQLLKFTILKDNGGTKWDESFKELQVEGRITQKVLIEILLLLLKREEAREKA